MKMKFFTLSAVCVLVYGLMVALSGVTGLAGISHDGEYGSHEGKIKEYAGNDALEDPVSPSSSIQDLGPPTSRHPVVEGYSTEGRFIDHAGQIRVIGILFILGWIFLSVRLLIAE